MRLARTAGPWPAHGWQTDPMPGPLVTLGGYRLPAWRLAAVAGSLAGILLAAVLAAAVGRSPALAAGVALAGALGGLALALARSAWYGSRGYTSYHHQLAALVSGSLFLWLLGQPLLPYLGLAVPGLALAVAVGRLGCLLAGCCHGRPLGAAATGQGWGICYGDRHVAAGFPRYLAGVRLFPLQALEVLWALGIALAGSALALRCAPPAGCPAAGGAVLAWYLVSYALGRFGFEFLRGDAARPYWRGLSEAQWTSLLAVGGAAGAELAGILPFQAWHAVAAALLAAGAAAVALRPSAYGRRHRLLHARHVQEVAEAMSAAETAALARARGELAGGIQVARTSLGLQISAGVYPNESGVAGWHYALSRPSDPLDEAAARALGALMFRLRPRAQAWQILTPPLAAASRGRGGRSERGVFHVLLSLAEQAPSPLA